jgi:hypothetical protein
MESMTQGRAAGAWPGWDLEGISRMAKTFVATNSPMLPSALADGSWKRHAASAASYEESQTGPAAGQTSLYDRPLWITRGQPCEQSRPVTPRPKPILEEVRRGEAHQIRVDAVCYRIFAA